MPGIADPQHYRCQSETATNENLLSLVTMSKLQLEVGKKYVDGLGKVIKIIEHRPALVHEYRGDNNETYTKNGVYDQNHNGLTSKYDLVREVPQPKIEE